ncbi:MAG TPA: hypothetical protein VGM95_00685 [Lactobacillaceae bacterium]|jgi:uncharacterized protein YlxW (UPF0749 family)
MKLTGIQKTLFGVLLTVVFFTGMGSASYYFGVKTIDTEGITKLNTGITNIKQQLSDANTSNTALASANADLTTKLDLANTDKSTLQAALDDRFSKLTSIGSLLGIDVSSYENTDDATKALVSAIDDKIVALQNNAVSDDTAALKQKISDLQATVDALTAKLNDPQTGLDHVTAVLEQAQADLTVRNDVLSNYGTTFNWMSTGPIYNPISNPPDGTNAPSGSSISQNPLSVTIDGETTYLLTASGGAGVIDHILWDGSSWEPYYTNGNTVYMFVYGQWVTPDAVMDWVKNAKGERLLKMYMSAAKTYTTGYVPVLTQNAQPKWNTTYKSVEVKGMATQYGGVQNDNNLYYFNSKNVTYTSDNGTEPLTGDPYPSGNPWVKE